MPFIYGFTVGRFFLKINATHVYLENLPKEFEGYHITQISDLHYGNGLSAVWAKYVLKKADDIPSDLIVLTGDYVKKRKCSDELIKVFSEIDKLSAPDGVFLVLGNHDNWADRRLAVELANRNNKNLERKAILLKRGGGEIFLAGLEDKYRLHHKLDSLLEKAPVNALRIILAHNPDSSEMSHSSSVDLYLCGHTHGGQLVVPFINYAPQTPIKNKNLRSGLVRNKFNELVYVNNGVGWGRVPFRIFVRPEIAVLVLHCK